MKLRLLTLLLHVILSTTTLLAQKAAVDEVGFNPERLYQFNDVDSVNLLNGNVTIILPIGQVYSVGATLSYQFRLIYNGKNYEYETYYCADDESDPVQTCFDAVPARRTNAGLGWQFSLGKLLDPYESPRQKSSFDRLNWTYEGPAGDEHVFGHDDPNATVMLSADPQPMRLVRVTDFVREVEFPSGEVHRFSLRDGVWRLVQMRDRSGNHVNVAYTFAVIEGRERETSWTITDSAGRTHEVSFEYHSALYETWSRGQNVDSVSLESFGGSSPSVYTLAYDPTGTTLTSVTSPITDAAPYTFAYIEYGQYEKRLQRLELPTGGSIEYTYQNYYLAVGDENICANAPWGSETYTPGVKTRTLSDGLTSHMWEYVQRRGPEVPVNWTEPKQKCIPEDPYDVNYTGPFYWSRTSVLSPLDDTGGRTRTDHYFDIFGEPAYPDLGAHPFPVGGEYGRAGVRARPPDETAKGSVTTIPEETLTYPNDVSGDDGTNEHRYLASRVYGNCAASGDCTAGTLLRSTYFAYECDDTGYLGTPRNCWVRSTRTVYEDDTSCAGVCYVQQTSSGRTGGGWDTTVTTQTNIPADGRVCTETTSCPDAVVSVDYTAYTPWSGAERYSALNAWITNTYTEKSRTEGASRIRTQFQFNQATGALEAARTLKNDVSRSADDILTVWTRDAKGNVVQERSFGGDGGGLETTECCATPATRPQYVIKRTWDAANHLTSEMYLDPLKCADVAASGCLAEPVLTTRDVVADAATGLITTSRDPAGIATLYEYDAWGRLLAVRPAEGAALTYAYMEATTGAPAHVTERQMAGSTIRGESTYEFDGLGRVKRVSRPLPNGKVATTQTNFDEFGRAAAVSQSVEGGSHPTTDVGTYWTTTEFDAVGRPISMTAPDGSETTLEYDGIRTVRRTTMIATPTNPATPTTTVERYDALGRLRGVTEPSGGAPYGAMTQQFTTTYQYDPAGRLSRVSSVDGVQPDRVFEYDGRGFLTSEQHPESGETTYADFDSRGHAATRSNGGNSIRFEYDVAERLTGVFHWQNQTATPIKRFTFEHGRRKTAMRRNQLPYAGAIEVTETDSYSTGGLLSRRVTRVESVLATSRSLIQEFSYSVTHDPWRLPATVTLPVCSAHGCTAAAGLPALTFERDAGRLTNVPGFGAIGYHASGMVGSVEHSTDPISIDVYSATAGLPRPSTITFGGGTEPPPCNPPTAAITTESALAPEAQAVASLPILDGATYFWMIDNGEILGGQSTNSVSYKAGCARFVVLTVQIVANCGAVAEATVSIPIIGAVSWPQNRIVASGETATLMITPPAGTITTWYAGASGTESPVLHTGNSFTTPTLLVTSRYWCRVTFPGGCSEDSPTLTVEVCRLPEIVEPAPDSLVPLPVAPGDTVRADVTAVATGITYSWYRVRMAKDTSGAWVGGEEILLPHTGADAEWVATSTSDEPEVWAFRVTVSGACAGAVPITRIVRMFEVAPRACATPRFFGYLPREVRVWWPNRSVTLDAPLADGADPAEHIFEWSVNGAPDTSGLGQMSFSVRLDDLQARYVTLRVYKQCGSLRSAAITDASFLYADEVCPIPTLSVDQSTVTAGVGTFTARSTWRSVDFQWYRGDSGDIREPIAGATLATFSPPTVGTYWVRAESKCGTTADSTTLLAVTESCVPPQFVRQPPAHTNSHAGQAVTLSFEATPEPTIVTWYADGQLLESSTNTSLADAPTRTTEYVAKVPICSTGSFNRTRVAVVHVFSCDDVSIIQQPVGANINEGQSVSLSVIAGSAYPLVYAWYEGETGDTTNPVPGGTAPSITVSPDLSTRYWVRITVQAYGGCAIDSTDVPVTVCRKPEIPAADMTERVSSFPGQRHYFESRATGERLSFKWFRGLAGSAEEPGDQTTLLSTQRSVMVDPAATMDFWLQVTSGCAPLDDAVSKKQYRVSVCPEIITDAWAVQPKVMPGTSATLNVEAARGDTITWFEVGKANSVGSGVPFVTAPIHGSATFYARIQSGLCWLETARVTVSLCDQPTVWWDGVETAVRKGSTQTLQVNFTSSGATPVFLFYRGPKGDVADSVLLAATEHRAIGIQPDVTTSYWVRAQEPNGCFADTPQIVVNVCIPQIQTQPVNSLIMSGASAELSVATDIDATASLTYSWFAGTPGNTTTPVGTGRTITVSPAVDTTYWVRISSSCTTVDSTAATVTVCRPPAITEQPTPVTGYAGVTAHLRVVAQGTNLSYQWYRGQSGNTSDPLANRTSSTLELAVSVTTSVWVRVTGHCGSVDSRAVLISIMPVITDHPDGAAVTKGTTRTLSVTASGAMLTYEWYRGVGDAEPVAAANGSSYTAGPFLTDSEYWVRVTSGAWCAESEPALITVCQPRTPVVTYDGKVSGSLVVLGVTGADPDEMFEWYAGTSGDTTTFLDGGSSFGWRPQETSPVWVRTKRFTCDADSATMTVLVCIPRITVQPQSGSTLSGTSATLAVTATGTGPLTYQWYAGATGNTSQPVAGATSRTFTTTPLTAPATYWVRVSSPAQSGCSTRTVDSQAATINICNVPAITSTTGEMRTLSGSAVTLSVTATGGNLLYEWHQGAVGSGPIVGTTSSISVAPSATTTYWVRVYNGCGSVNSNAIRVSVYPVITQQPVDTAGCLNSTVRFSVTATGADLSYVWYRQYPSQSAQIVGGNQPYVDLTVTADATVYCRITSGTATTNSNTAALTTSPQPGLFTLSKQVYTSTSWKLTATIQPEDEFLVQYEWYRGALGDTTNRINSSLSVIVVTPPSLPQTYWVRVKYIDTGCYRDKAITIQ